MGLSTPGWGRLRSVALRSGRRRWRRRTRSAPARTAARRSSSASCGPAGGPGGGPLPEPSCRTTSAHGLTGLSRLRLTRLAAAADRPPVDLPALWPHAMTVNSAGGDRERCCLPGRRALRLDRIWLGARDVTAAMGEPPDQRAGLRHFQVPARAALASVVPAAGWMAVALARPPALGVRDDVIKVALLGRSPTTRRRARRVPDLDQVAKKPAGNVRRRLARMRARPGLEPVHGEAADPRDDRRRGPILRQPFCPRPFCSGRSWRRPRRPVSSEPRWRGARTGVADRVAVRSGDRQAVATARLARQRAGYLAAAPRIKHAATCGLSWAVRDAQPRTERHGQMHRAERAARPGQAESAWTGGFASLRGHAFARHAGSLPALFIRSAPAMLIGTMSAWSLGRVV